MSKKDPGEVRRRELQKELLSALRRRDKLEVKIERLREKLRQEIKKEDERP